MAWPDTVLAMPWRENDCRKTNESSPKRPIRLRICSAGPEFFLCIRFRPVVSDLNILQFRGTRGPWLRPALAIAHSAAAFGGSSEACHPVNPPSPSPRQDVVAVAIGQNGSRRLRVGRVLRHNRQFRPVSLFGIAFVLISSDCRGCSIRGDEQENENNK